MISPFAHLIKQSNDQTDQSNGRRPFGLANQTKGAVVHLVWQTKRARPRPFGFRVKYQTNAHAHDHLVLESNIK